jgi:uncharacterized membrane protein
LWDCRTIFQLRHQLGFATERNPLLVVAVAGIITGLLGHLSPQKVLAAFGDGFASSRLVTIFVITLPFMALDTPAALPPGGDPCGCEMRRGALTF